MRLIVNHDEDRITFISENNEIYGSTEYTSHLWGIIEELNWYVSDTDLKNGKRTYIYTGSTPFTKRYKKLYEIVMCAWYGKEIVDQMRDRKFIIEHLDNDPHNCSIENLTFAHEDFNKAKAFSFDKVRPALLAKVAMNIYKNFSAQEYEITLGFNDSYTLTTDEDGESKTIPLNALFLKYSDDFETLIMEANFIANSFKKELDLNIDALNCLEYRCVPANFLITPIKKPLPCFIKYNGLTYLILSENTRLIAIGPSWKSGLLNSNLK
ncbi:hypothetical protein FQV26_10440 [Planococcus sp. CPCC 101016]|uniref:hypothetical protein n=1 Tax=Planococcus sp. CPCC 101016 TaxID=2599617 RepID=UPI0011B4FAD8|nr:hypothetical protein [Planococcus sp. CPCC 101016]TWT08202.1 hypothetical protein FQV26_10440 [Planococcus sp. CPCC 101016]